jgi:hypothetical protein
VLAREQLVQRDAQREDVRAVIDRLPPHLLGRHVADRSHELPRPGRRRLRRLPAVAGQPIRDLRQAKVEQLQPPFARDEDVLRLDVAVDDPLRVGGGQPLRHLHGEPQDLALARGPVRHHLPQRLALEQLRDDVRHALVRTDIEDREDVRVTQGGDGASLALEPREPLRVEGHILGQDLDRDFPPQTRVPRPIDLPHAAGPEKAEDLVRSQVRSGSQWHGRSAVGSVRLA